MERVAFLIEKTGQRLECLLNPETVEIQRVAGVSRWRSGSGVITGMGTQESPLLYTGGGTTELKLELVFDLSWLPKESVPIEDIRTVTAPFWNLAENSENRNSYGHPPLVRFVWGKSWNIPGVVVSVAERLECFTSQGAPQRSWLLMKFIRVEDEPAARSESEQAPSLEKSPMEELSPELLASFETEGDESVMEGETVNFGERLDEIAFRYYGYSFYWRLLAAFNDIDDPLDIPTGTNLQVPPLSILKGTP